MNRIVSCLLISFLALGLQYCNEIPELPAAVTAKVLDSDLAQRRVSLVATQSNDQDVRGTWSITSVNKYPGEFSNINDPLAYFTGDVFETYTVRWTMTNGHDEKFADTEFSISTGHELYEFIQAGIPVSRLLEVYLTYDLLLAHVPVADLIAAGATTKNLVAAEVPVSELLDLGLQPLDLYTNGAPVKDLIVYDRKNIKILFDAGATINQLAEGGALLKEIKSLGITDDQLKTAGIIGTLEDIDGNTYRWVKIGGQVWMADNLKATRNADGTAFSVGGYPVEVYAAGGDESNVEVYGRLYGWALNNSAYSSSNPSGVQGVCPNGWHLPSALEWEELSAVLGADVGAKLKTEGTLEEGNGLWASSGNSSVIATNESGFNAAPSGYRYYNDNGSFHIIPMGNATYFWTSTAYHNESKRAIYSLGNDSNDLGFSSGDYHISAYPVRCVRN